MDVWRVTYGFCWRNAYVTVLVHHLTCECGVGMNEPSHGWTLFLLLRSFGGWLEN